MKKIAFIGGGNLAQALISGLLASKKFVAADIMVAEPAAAQREKLADSLAVATTADNEAAVTFGDVILLTVKPNIYPLVIDQIKHLVNDKLIITVAAGITSDYVLAAFGQNVRIVRSMPNTPAAVAAGMTSISAGRWATDDDLAFARTLFGSVGEVELIDEKLMDVAMAVAGCSPAIVYMFIESLADGAVLKGMPRQQAYRYAAQAVLGSAKMVLDSALHPGQLKDAVASPGGTTIEAIRQLEKGAFRSNLIEAIAQSVDKSIAMKTANKQ